MKEDRWIRPGVATVDRIEEADGVVISNGVRFAVKRARVAAMKYHEAAPVVGTVRSQNTKGPFQVGPMCVGRVYSESDGIIDAEWYFELF